MTEDEAIKQERLRVRLLRRKTGGAIEHGDVGKPRGVHARHGIRRHLVGSSPLPDRQFDRHAFRIHPLRIEADECFQPLTGAGAVEARLLFDRRNSARAPALQNAVKQSRTVAETTVKAAFGDPEVFGQHLDSNTVDARSRDFADPGFDPDLASAVTHRSPAFLIRCRIANPP